MKELEALRERIDRIDEALVKAFCERLEVSGEIGKLKREKGLPITDEEREAAVTEHAERLAEKHAGLTKSLYKRIFTLCKAYEQEAK